MKIADATIIGKKRVISLNKNGDLPVYKGINRALFEEAIIDITIAITNGTPLDDKYYRKSTGPDYLLSKLGWLHLHVGYGIDDNVLLIVEQHTTYVLFIGLFDHRIFQDRPIGASIQKWLGADIAKANLPPKKALPPVKESLMRKFINIVKFFG